MRKSVHFDNGVMSGIIHYRDKDAVFTLGGCKISMDYHSYLGPEFWFNLGREGERIFQDWYEFPELVAQYDGWWEAKGKYVYADK